MAEGREEVLAGDGGNADRPNTANRDEGRAETLGASKSLRDDSSNRKPPPREAACDVSEPSDDEGRTARG